MRSYLQLNMFQIRMIPRCLLIDKFEKNTLHFIKNT